MAATTRAGFVSFKTLIFLACVFGAGAFLFGPARSWGEQQLSANSARHVEFDRRVKAQRHAAIRPELEQAGIHIEEAPAPADSAAFSERPVAQELSLGERVTRWWGRLWREEPAESAPVMPVLRDSLGLLPGERMFLPNGRVVEYDTTTFHYQPPAK